MSTLSQFSGGGVKSVQRGTITVSGTSQTNTATITAVDTSKSMISFTGFSGGAMSTYDNWPRLFLTNSTTVTATRNGSSFSVVVSYEVIEFY